MKLFTLTIFFCFLQACSQQSFNASLINSEQLNALKSLLNKPAQCRPLNEGKVNWPIREPSQPNKSNIDCKKSFKRLVGQSLYFYNDYDPDVSGSVLLQSNFFKYPEAVDCLDEQDNFITCPGLDIEKVVFSKKTETSLTAIILHPDQTTNTATVNLVDNEKICQIRFSIHSATQKYKTETYNILALYDGRQEQNSNAPLCDEEALALSPVFQDDQARALCKEQVEKDYQDALNRIDPRDRDALRERANQLKKKCDQSTPNQLRVNFFLTPELS
ncbi:MAG: hypothetical protein HAW63_01730 [Bdellovibrionaceae bacterium]|nr:hypothetical protein [Pseudobdellovibrionaceae bacterium]